MVRLALGKLVIKFQNHTITLNDKGRGRKTTQTGNVLRLSRGNQA